MTVLQSDLGNTGYVSHTSIACNFWQSIYSLSERARIKAASSTLSANKCLLCVAYRATLGVMRRKRPKLSVLQHNSAIPARWLWFWWILSCWSVWREAERHVNWARLRSRAGLTRAVFYLGNLHPRRRPPGKLQVKKFSIVISSTLPQAAFDMTKLFLPFKSRICSAPHFTLASRCHGEGI